MATKRMEEMKEVGAKRDMKEIPGLQYAILSYVAPEGARQRGKNTAIKIRGAFATKEEADEHCKALWELDPNFDMFIVDMYEWLVIPIPMDDFGKIRMTYNQDKLDRIMDGYYQQVEKSKKDLDNRVLRAKKLAKKKAEKVRKRRNHATSQSTTESEGKGTTESTDGVYAKDK